MMARAMASVGTCVGLVQPGSLSLVHVEVPRATSTLLASSSMVWVTEPASTALPAKRCILGCCMFHNVSPRRQSGWTVRHYRYYMRSRVTDGPGVCWSRGMPGKGCWVAIGVVLTTSGQVVMWSYKAKRVCMRRRAVCMYVCVCVRMCRSVSVKTNLNAAVSGPKKRVTGVRYGLRADRLYGELRTNGAHEVR